MKWNDKVELVEHPRFSCLSAGIAKEVLRESELLSNSNSSGVEPDKWVAFIDGEVELLGYESAAAALHGAEKILFSEKMKPILSSIVSRAKGSGDYELVEAIAFGRGVIHGKLQQLTAFKTHFSENNANCR